MDEESVGPNGVEKFEGVPGLFFHHDFLTREQCSRLVARSIDLYDRLEAAIASAERREQAAIPQPAFVRSSKHNLQSEERFVRVELSETGGRTIRGEYFPRYGEEGHSLGYFRGGSNLPDLVVDELLEPVHAAMLRDGLAEAGRDLLWKFTVNYYRNVDGAIAGFPFHVDIPANGVVTMILNIHREALFQIAKDDVVHDVQLAVGGLLILSGESRYEWKHRVLPTPAPPAEAANLVQRVSLVLGFQ